MGILSQQTDFSWSDDFNRGSVGTDWDGTNTGGLSMISSTKLRVTAKTNTWGQYIGALHVLTVPITGDFEIETNVTWDTGSSPLGHGLIMVCSGTTGTTTNANGVYGGHWDAWNIENGVFSAGVAGNTYQSATKEATSGNITVKITRYSGQLKAYRNGVLMWTSTSSSHNTAFTHIKLTNSNLNTYSSHLYDYDYVTLVKK